MQSLFWHDYETFGTDTQKDRPCQFAGIRTDLDLNIIGEPTTIYCRPAEDFLPSPEACLVTGITPQIALQEGVIESEFAEIIYQLFSVPGTCVAGYNSIRFDDEVTRNLFYRNFLDPYEREWKDGNSRWDIIDLVRLTYALRPEGIVWPTDENQQISFRLEKLTEANGIEHASAHDAMSDVYATIAIAKLIKESQPKLYQYIFEARSKKVIRDLFEMVSHKPVLHISSKYPVSLGCCALVAPLFNHPKNNNGIVVLDLRQNPELMLSLSVERIRELLYTPSNQLPVGTERPALKTIHLNKCPMVVPASMIKTLSTDTQLERGIDLESTMKHLEFIREHPELLKKLYAVFDVEFDRPEKGDDPDLMLYRGGFFSQNDKAEMSRVRSSSDVELTENEFRFQDSRLEEMLIRFKARNYPSTLNEVEQDRWLNYCSQKLMSKNSVYLNFSEFFERLGQCSNLSNGDTPRGRAILEDLKYYAESIIPYQ